jgi:hypothetical protein
VEITIWIHSPGPGHLCYTYVTYHFTQKKTILLIWYNTTLTQPIIKLFSDLFQNKISWLLLTWEVNSISIVFMRKTIYHLLNIGRRHDIALVFKRMSLVVLAFELNLVVVKLVEEEALVIYCSRIMLSSAKKKPILIWFWCLTPLSAIFQLYHGDALY